MAEVNLDGVQFERARKVVDLPFAAAKKALASCYYGEQDAEGRYLRDGNSGWKFGHSAPFNGLDILTSTMSRRLKDVLGVTDEERLSPSQAEKLYNLTKQAMEAAYQVALIKANRKLDTPYSEDDINRLDSLVKNRIFADALVRKETEFNEALKSAKINTVQELVDLYNSFPLTISEDEAISIERKGDKALKIVRQFEALTGLKVRSLVGTLPES